MAISIDTAPGTLCQASHPIWYRFSTDDHYTAEEKASFDLLFSGVGPQTNGQELRITVGGVLYTFVAIETVDPPPDLLEFTHNGTLAEPLFTWVERFVDQMKRHHIINSFFEITFLHDPPSSESTVTFTMRGSGTYGSVTENVGNCALTNNNSYTAGSFAHENFSMVLELWVEKNWQTTDWELAHEYQKIPGLDNLGALDIHRELAPYLTCSPPAYDLAAPDVEAANGPICRFYMRYRERYGDPPADQTQSLEGTTHAALAGGHRWEKHFGADLLDDLNGAGGSDGKFLTLQPREKRITATQKEFLYLMNYDNDANNLSVEVTAYFTDGTTESEMKIPSDTDNDQAPMSIWCIPAGYGQLDVGSINGAKTVYKYTLEVYSGTVQMEAFTFYVDHIGHEHERLFIIPNSLGGMDTLLANGYQNRNLKRVQELVERNPEFSTVASDAMIRTLRDDHDRVMQATAGPYDPEWQAYLEDLFLSHGQAYELVDSIWVPVIFLNSEMELLDENSDQKTLSFSYQYAYHSKTYQP